MTMSGAMRSFSMAKLLFPSSARTQTGSEFSWQVPRPRTPDRRKYRALKGPSVAMTACNPAPQALLGVLREIRHPPTSPARLSLQRPGAKRGSPTSDPFSPSADSPFHEL